MGEASLSSPIFIKGYRFTRHVKLVAPKIQQPNRLELSNQRFGRLIVLEDLGIERVGSTTYRYWGCVCDCGNKVAVRGTPLVKGITKSCGCLHREVSGQQATRRNRKEFGRDAWFQVYNSYRSSANRRGYEWNLSEEDFLKVVVSPCLYCGVALENTRTGRKDGAVFRYTGLDRIDNTLGYITTNLAPCCTKCNLAKRDMTTSEFCSLIVDIHVHQSTRTLF